VGNFVGFPNSHSFLPGNILAQSLVKQDLTAVYESIVNRKNFTTHLTKKEIDTSTHPGRLSGLRQLLYAIQTLL
jgi:hypothetical protein